MCTIPTSFTDRWLDLDGDGYLTEADISSCFPEIGVSVPPADERGAARTVLYAMDSRDRGLGQVTFKVNVSAWSESSFNGSVGFGGNVSFRNNDDPSCFKDTSVASKSLEGLRIDRHRYNSATPAEPGKTHRSNVLHRRSGDYYISYYGACH